MKRMEAIVSSAAKNKFRLEWLAFLVFIPRRWGTVAAVACSLWSTIAWATWNAQTTGSIEWVGMMDPDAAGRPNASVQAVQPTYNGLCSERCVLFVACHYHRCADVEEHGGAGLGGKGEWQADHGCS